MPARARWFVTAATGNCPEAAMKLPGGGRESCPLAVVRSARHEFVCLAASRGWGLSWSAVGGAETPTAPRRDTVKSAEEIMNMLEAFDLTGSLRDAGELAVVSHHTVARYVAAREAGGCLIDRRLVRS